MSKCLSICTLVSPPGPACVLPQVYEAAQAGEGGTLLQQPCHRPQPRVSASNDSVNDCNDSDDDCNGSDSDDECNDSDSHLVLSQTRSSLVSGFSARMASQQESLSRSRLPSRLMILMMIMITMMMMMMMIVT